MHRTAPAVAHLPFHSLRSSYRLLCHTVITFGSSQWSSSATPPAQQKLANFVSRRNIGKIFHEVMASSGRKFTQKMHSRTSFRSNTNLKKHRAKTHFLPFKFPTRLKIGPELVITSTTILFFPASALCPIQLDLPNKNNLN